MKQFFFFFAVAGWILSLIVHALALNDVNVTESAPYVWALHVGIFVVWLPAIIYLNKNQELRELKKTNPFATMNPVTVFRIFFKNTPTWLIVIAIAGFFYAFINFMLFMKTQLGTPEIKDGQFILTNHGQMIKTLTEQEYHHCKANEVRGFSGHWIAFYGMAAALLFPFMEQNTDGVGAKK
jgi:hypothetical protein